MTRIVKKPEIRKAEILTTAQRLFYQKGYEDTSVNEIIQYAGIAKGTFYHYFKSKNDVIDEIATKHITQIADEIESILEDEFYSPSEKLNAFFVAAGFFKQNNRALTSIFIKLIFLKENMPIKDRISDVYIRQISPLLTRLINQFPVWENEEENKILKTAEFILLAYFNLAEELSNILLYKIPDDKELDSIITKTEVFAEIVEKIIGIEKGTVTLMNNEMITKYFEIFSTT